ncbi:T3SS effector HopA1 family protein [Streptomyces sp. SYSU K217416]
MSDKRTMTHPTDTTHPAGRPYAAGNARPDPAAPALAPVFLSVLDAVEWREPRTVAVRSPAGTTEVDLNGGRAVAELGRLLYETFHAGRPVTGPAADPDEEFTGLLLDSVRVPWTADPGWRVVRTEPDGGLLVEREGLRLTVDPARHLDPAAGSGGRSVVADTVTLRLPACRPNLSPGFFTVLGSRGAPGGPLVRWYLNLPSRSAPRFLSEITARLEAAGLRYAVKTLADPTAYGRRDGTVLYTEHAEHPEHTRATGSDPVVEALAAALPALPEPARPDIPPLCERVLPWVGRAEEPAGGAAGRLSFGEHRLDVVARLLAGRHGAPVQSLVAELAGALADAHIDPAAPHRNLPGGPS